ncbi:6-carboxytetrahydropterin synthase [Clostridium paraputrificum]|uniref:6-carboxytetrahydropterin synthase n=1 Tax=Clostridium paraputrificum TaxID=29363 RepID=UPI00325BF5D8
MKGKYILKYFLNAKHYVFIEGKKSIIHPHNWQLELDVKVESDEMISFRVIDKKIDEILNKFDDKVLNDEEEFQGIETTTENICRVLWEIINNSLNGTGYLLTSLKISENPSRTFVLER